MHSQVTAGASSQNSKRHKLCELDKAAVGAVTSPSALRLLTDTDAPWLVERPTELGCTFPVSCLQVSRYRGAFCPGEPKRG